LFRKTNYPRFHFRYNTLDNLCLLSSQKYSHNHIIIQVIKGWANRILIIQTIIIDIAVRIHIPRIVIATTTVTRHTDTLPRLPKDII